MNKISKTIYASAARTATPTAVTINTTGASALHLIIDVTAVGVTPTITISVDAYDDVSAKWYNILTSAGISTVSTTVLKIGQGLPVTANLSANDVVPNQLRITSTHTDATTITYSIGLNEIG